MGVKISNLPAIVTPALSDIFPVVQSGVTYKETFTQLTSLFATSGANSNITSLSGLTTPLSGAQGGTGVANTSKSITLGGNLTTSGAFASTFTMTNTTTVTFPTSGTLATTAQIPTGAALTKVDDTNVTLALGGSPTTSLINAASITAGWTGQLAVGRGGTGVSSVTTSPTASAFAGWDANSNLSANNFIEGLATTATAAGTTTLTVASAGVQEFTGSTTQTVVMPVASTLVAGFQFKIINNSSGVLTINSSGGNLILSMAANTTAFLTLVLASGTAAASWNASYVFDNGAGVLSITGTANQVIASASTGAVTLSLPQSIGTASAVQFASIAFSSTSGVIGTTTNDSAPAGSVGNYVSSVIAMGSAVSLVSGTILNLTSISLQAGDWDVWGNVSFVPNGGVTVLLFNRCWISSTSATAPDPSLYMANYYPPAFSPGLSVGLTAPSYRVTVPNASTTTLYLSCDASFSSSTLAACGGIYARVRR